MKWCSTFLFLLLSANLARANEVWSCTFTDAPGSTKTVRYQVAGPQITGTGDVGGLDHFQVMQSTVFGLVGFLPIFAIGRNESVAKVGGAMLVINRMTREAMLDVALIGPSTQTVPPIRGICSNN
jgi:hypothetical protein